MSNIKTNVSDKMSNIKTNISNVINMVKDATGGTSIIKMISFAIIFSMIILSIVYASITIKRNKTNCKNLDSLYPKFPKITSINNNQQIYNLRDYYIKTAYNACSAGMFKNDFVNICALKNAIKQGARCLDFEIYSLNDKPVIAVSPVSDFYTKGSYNSVNFDEAMDIISTYAFSNSTCPNPNDPILLHFRIMSNNVKIYDAMAKSLYTNLQTKMLDKQYSYEFEGKNLSAEPIKNLMGKVIIMVDRKNPLYQQTPLDEYVNIASGSIFLRNYTFSQIKNIQDFNELTEFNKKNMTIVLPDKSANDKNISSALPMTYGSQMIGMSLQSKSDNLEYYNKLFEEQNTAFVLKPEKLRYVPVTIPVPTPPNPAYSYEKREVKSDYYKFDI
jgi:hypothetical protein